MGDLIRAFDWSKTPVGSIYGWPQSLKTARTDHAQLSLPDVRLVGAGAYQLIQRRLHPPILGNRTPPPLGGPSRRSGRTSGTSSARRPSGIRARSARPGTRTAPGHGAATGTPRRRTSPSPTARCPTTTGRSAGCSVPSRRTRTESWPEASPYPAGVGRGSIPGQGSEAGVRGRRRHARREPARHPVRHDVPAGAGGSRATLAGLTGLHRDSPVSPTIVDLEGPDAAMAVPTGGRVPHGRPSRRLARIGSGLCRAGHGRSRRQRAVVLPMARPGQDATRRDSSWPGSAPAWHITTSTGGSSTSWPARSPPPSPTHGPTRRRRKRAEALAELDRAKTAFFSNVSHEFRTPLTLMLGPVEDALAELNGAVPPGHRERLEVVHRNGLRLLRLVNTLLDFSRIEAGPGPGDRTSRPTCAAFTADLASNFRSACERAGLRAGGRLPAAGRAGVRRPGDVGEGRPQPALQRLQVHLRGRDRRLAEAERARRRAAGPGHRRRASPPTRCPGCSSASTGSRTRGAAPTRAAASGWRWCRNWSSCTAARSPPRANSAGGRRFTVTVPLGSAHLPRERVGTSQTLTVTSTGASAFVEEALRWLPDARIGRDPAQEVPTDQEALSVPLLTPRQAESDRSRVLVADDNADMRRLRRPPAGRRV